MSNLFFTGRGVRTKLNIPFNLQYKKKKNSHLDLQLFASNKLISLDRMKDFLDRSKNIFYIESDLANENEITGIVEDQLIPKPVDLSYYAQNHIQDYQSITQIPQDNLNYLNSGLIANNMSYMFYLCYKLQSVPKLNIDTSQCTNMNHIFYGCQVLTSLDLSNFNTSNVTDMSNMFGNCPALTTIDLSDWDTGKVTDMTDMFYYCRALTTIINLSNFDTSNVTDMYEMFYHCDSLTSLDLSNFDTSNVTDMSSMFANCQALTTIDLSNWDTSKVTDMRMMFGNCNLLEHIEGIIDMKSCTDYRYMFNICSKLSGVKIKNPPNDFNFESKAGLSSSQYEIVS